MLAGLALTQLMVSIHSCYRDLSSRAVCTQSCFQYALTFPQPRSSIIHPAPMGRAITRLID